MRMDPRLANMKNLGTTNLGAAVKVLGVTLLCALLGASFGQETELPPGPEPVYRAEFQPTQLPETFSVISLVLEFPPSAETPLHSHPGPGIVLILEGELTGFDEAGNETVFRPGDTFEEGPGKVHRVRNHTDQPTRVLFTVLLPEGEALTTVHE